MPQTAPTKDLNFTNVMRVLTAPMSAVPQLLFPFLHPYPLRYSTKISPVNNSRLASQCSNKRYCLFLYVRGERWSSLHEEDMSVEAGQRWASCRKYPCWESKGRVLGGHFKRYSSEYIVVSKERAHCLMRGSVSGWDRSSNQPQHPVRLKLYPQIPGEEKKHEKQLEVGS